MPPNETSSGKSWITEKEPRARKGNGTLLLVDDDSQLLVVCGSMLRSLGFEVIAVPSGAEAIEAVQRHAAHLRAVLLDLMMPIMSGHETLKNLRSLARELPVIMFTGYSEEFVRKETKGHPYEGFIQKPLSLENLSAEIGRVLALKPVSPP